MTEVEFVVAHFNENLSWLSEVQNLAHVYSKGSPITQIAPLQHTTLPNIGREGHTYLHHICNHYDQLPRVLILVQGCIDDHITKTAVQMVEAASALGNDEVLTFGPSELESFDTWYGKHLDLYPLDITWPDEILREPPKSIKEAPLRPEYYFKRFFGDGNLPLKVAWQPGAIFAIPRMLIHRYSRQFYHDIREAFFGGPMSVNDPETGHFLEKFWLAMWKPEEYICWTGVDVSQDERNVMKQLAKGKWKVQISCIRDPPEACSQSVPQGNDTDHISTLSRRTNTFREAGAARDHFDRILKGGFHAENNSTGLINLELSENYIMADEVAAFLNKNLKLTGGDMTYGEGAWGSQRLRDSMARHLTKWLGPKERIDPNDLLFASGCTSLCEMLGFALFEEGDGILLSMPTYQAFQHDFGLRAKVKPVFVPSLGYDQFHGAHSYEKALLLAAKSGVRVRALMLVNPHNPLGQIYSPSAIIEYLKLAKKYQIHVIMDEIYSLSVYEPKAVFTSVLALDWQSYLDPAYLHVLNGLSKDFACGGLRLGCIWSKNHSLLEALAGMSPFNWPSNLSEAAACSILNNQQWVDQFIDSSRRTLLEASNSVRTILEEYGISYRKAVAGFFLWIDLRPFICQVNGKEIDRISFEDEREFSSKIKSYGVSLNSGENLSSEIPGFFRLCFVKPQEEVRIGLYRLSLALFDHGVSEELIHNAVAVGRPLEMVSSAHL